jgi:hypothetical protein
MTELTQARDRVSDWRTKNPDKAGTPEYDTMTDMHRLLTDLIDRGGGTAEEREYVMRQMDGRG